jgi:hypothetical protein
VTAAAGSQYYKRIVDKSIFFAEKPFSNTFLIIKRAYTQPQAVVFFYMSLYHISYLIWYRLALPFSLYNPPIFLYAPSTIFACIQPVFFSELIAALRTAYTFLTDWQYERQALDRI